MEMVMAEEQKLPSFGEIVNVSNRKYFWVDPMGEQKDAQPAPSNDKRDRPKSKETDRETNGDHELGGEG
jgi:hypothetical protein